jgi:hypothetical protein
MNESRWQLGKAPTDDALFRHLGDGILLMAMQVTGKRWIARIFRGDERIWAGDDDGYHSLRDATRAADFAWVEMAVDFAAVEVA